jgi:hypothetical protein
MQKTLFLLFSLFSITYSYSQTGPGGVGSSSSNLIWVKADEIPTLIDNDLVTSWPDISGNSNNLSQPNSSFQPIFKTSIINGKPVVRFNKADNRLRKTSFASPTNAITAIYVNSTLDNGDGVISYASSASPNDFLFFNSSNLAVWVNNNSTNSGISSNNGTFHIINTSWRSSDGSTEVWKDGNRSYTTSGFQTGIPLTTGGSIALANEQDAIDGAYETGQAHEGDFAEVILFNTFLNTAQHIIVANYLAAKYNLTIANDYYAYQATHGNHLAGIGRENASNTHTEARSNSILQIGNPSGLNTDKEYLLFGHENGSIAAWTTTEAPDAGVNIQRIAREWRMDETGDVGTVDFTIDVANLPALPVGHTMYTLMIDSDGDFSNGAQVYEMVLTAGTEYEVTGIEISDGDYVSIAAVDPKVHHTTATSNGFEPNNASIQVSLNFIPATDRTVDFTTADGSALIAQPDYNAAAASTLTILAGNQTQNYTVTITNDVVVESSETFSVTLSNPSAGIDLGTNIVHTYTINDDDDSRKIYFNLATSSGSEATTPANIAVSINNVDAVNPTTVDYTVTGGTAIGSGTDYTLAAGTLTIPAGSTTANIVIAINNDVNYELDETIIIELSNPTNTNLDGAVPLGGTGFLEHTFTIINDDPAPVIEFDIPTNSGVETATPVSIQINLDAPSTFDATANYTLSGTASGSGVDYTLANGTITISAGNTTNSLSLIIHDDVIDELNETVILTLSAPVNVTIGTNSTYTYTIIDNEEFGYLGPGGVGNSTTNKIWVKPEDLTIVADATDITSWPDVSGNSNNLAQSNASFKPRYYNNVINGKPVARFNQSNGRLVKTSFSGFPTTAITTYFVNKNGDSGDGLISYAPSSALNNDYLLFNSSNINVYLQNTNTSTSNAINGNIWRIVNHTWRSSDGQNRIYINGNQTYNGTLSTGNSMTSGGALALAGEQDAVDGGYDAGQSHQGDFAEFFIYNTVLNTARKKIVDNYLAAKYNLTTTSDLYSYDAPGTYENEVAGIGKDDNSNFHDDAQGSAIVRINNPSSLDNGDYLLWGHDNANRTLDTVDIPMGIDNRMNRVWRIQETGDVGTVTVHFDLGAFTVGSSSDLFLLITSDGSFVNASQTAVSSYAGTVATFENIDLTNGDYFTAASSVRANPLPIKLISFDAYLSNEQVELTWSTASEINNNFFTIERTNNGVLWQVVETIEGAGNANSRLDYHSTDKDPLQGTSYYRLKQTDYDGQSEISAPVVINYHNKSTHQLKVYPNPTRDQITIEGSSKELKSIRIYNIQGVDITKGIQFNNKSETQVELNISHLNNGTYIVRTDDSFQFIIKK